MAKNRNVQLSLNIPEDKVNAEPTKKFFVKMLTRDIDLIDAIMDLIDNCIDGVHRQKKGKSGGQFYKGFYANIIIDAKNFTIKDNCGGIPEDVAKNYAFRMGREDSYQADKNLETVGVYGIGMKRAIFKIGNEASVYSHHAKSCFKVIIPSNWSQTDDWYFDFEKLQKSSINSILPKEGTQLSITKLHDNISRRFADKPGFIKDLEMKLKEHYGYIIQQGFSIKLNGTEIPSLELKIIKGDPKKGKKSINPYVYYATMDGVSVEVIVGFYRPPVEPEELENALEGTYAKATSDNAGVTVLCNDRIVLFNNKDHLTGWGDSPVPSFHTQFINIAGVVHFRSKTPEKLPVTTTKRGLDTSSLIYSKTRTRIKEGLKIFTSFTNQWKERTEERSKLFQNTETIDALLHGQTKKHFKLSKPKKGDEGEYFVPILPKPDDDAREKNITISFQKEKAKVDKMRSYYFNGKNKPASDIGSWCFDELYSQVD